MLLQTTGSGTETKGAIIASGLQLLGSGGSYVLGSSNNQIETLAGNTGSLDFTNGQGYAVGTVTNSAVNPISTTGITTTAGDIDLHKGATSTDGYIAINAELNSGGGNIVLDVSGVGGETKNGSTQGSGSSAAIVANGLTLLGSGSHTLTNPGNRVSLLAGAGSVGGVTGTGSVQFTDSQALSIGLLSTGGVTTNGLNSSGDVTLTIVGNLTQSQLLEVDGTLSGSAMSVDLDNSSNAIANLGGSLGLTAGGNFTLNDAKASGLTVTGAVKSTAGLVSITNASGLTVAGTGSVSGNGVSLTTETPVINPTVSLANSLYSQIVSGGGTAGNDIILNGLVNGGSGTVTLNSAGSINQTGGIITAVTLTGSTGNTGTTTAALYSASNVITNLGQFTTHGDFALNDTNAGGLTVTGAVNSGIGSVVINSNNGITEGGQGSVTTGIGANTGLLLLCLLYTSPSPRD